MKRPSSTDHDGLESRAYRERERERERERGRDRDRERDEAINRDTTREEGQRDKSLFILAYCYGGTRMSNTPCLFMSLSHNNHTTMYLPHNVSRRCIAVEPLPPAADSGGWKGGTRVWMLGRVREEATASTNPHRKRGNRCAQAVVRRRCWKCGAKASEMTRASDTEKVGAVCLY